MFSIRVALWAALAWCTADLLRAAVASRRFRAPSEPKPARLIQRAIGVTALACVLSVLLIGWTRPGSLAGVVIVFALLARQIVRDTRSTPSR